jgi:hypothetical protein
MMEIGSSLRAMSPHHSAGALGGGSPVGLVAWKQRNPPGRRQERIPQRGVLDCQGIFQLCWKQRRLLMDASKDRNTMRVYH